MDNKIGEFIFKLRKENGLTQEELAEKLVMVRENVSKMERGVNKPTIETLLKLSNIFDVSVSELLAGKRKNEINSKEFDTSNSRFNNERLSKYKKLILLVIFFFMIIISIIISSLKINETKVYLFDTNELKIEGLLIFKDYGYIDILNSNKEGNKYIFYYFERYNNPSHYSFTFFDINKKRVEDDIKEKEVILLETTNLEKLNYFKYNIYQRNMIVNNSYLKIINDNEETIIKLKYKDL